MFLSKYLLCIILLIPIGFARDLETLVVVRIFSRLLNNTVAGVISNVFRDNRERSVSISLYMINDLVLISISFVIGAIIIQYLD
ncbi:uncharacterized protein EAF01_003103 [Botrytis porri]|uniref:uncharacterized protein n=1 Tax=Botrytis porri TaxID=87229 RepID=UPI00190034A7|nr:uncharacterized protein EAF01_003103 [Botrytis porri]KAF7909385.1 hypothetical protein EAF01_003103 [Botrytis porri]